MDSLVFSVNDFGSDFEVYFWTFSCKQEIDLL
jgi:hypothetical protein